MHLGDGDGGGTRPVGGGVRLGSSLFGRTLVGDVGTGTILAVGVGLLHVDGGVTRR